MQLKITTDYAIRTVLHLAETKRITTSAEIAEAMSIPREYLINIIRDMRAGGLVDTFTGARGGYMLARAPQDITLYDIVMTMEKTIRINRCLEEDGYCSRYAVGFCAVHQVYSELQNTIEECLKGCTVADLLGQLRENDLSPDVDVETDLE